MILDSTECQSAHIISSYVASIVANDQIRLEYLLPASSVHGNDNTKVKACYVTWARLVTRSTVQSRKWQLIGTSYDTVANYAATRCML